MNVDVDQLSAVYEAASMGTGDGPDLVLVTYTGFRYICIKTGGFRLWQQKRRELCMDGFIKYDPTRLPV